MLSTCQIVRCQGNYLFALFPIKSTSRTVCNSHVLVYYPTKLVEPIHTSHLVKTHLIHISFSFVANFQKIHFTLRLNVGEFGRSTDIHVYLFWNICSRTDESSCHRTERSVRLVHMLSHPSKMAPASLPLCLPVKGKAAHQTADKNLDKKGIFYSQPSTKREKCGIRDRRNLLLFRLWTLNSLSVLMRKQDQRNRWHLSCVISL